MIDLLLNAPEIEWTRVETIAARLVPHFHSVTVGCGLNYENQRKPDTTFLEMEIITEELPAPFRVHGHHGVTVSTWQSEGICSYAGISEDLYLALCGLLGVSQWRALQANPLLKMEDLKHPVDANCLFIGPGSIHEYVLLLEDPCVCGGCIDFYHCLGADRELVAVRETLKLMRASGTGVYSDTPK